MGILGFSSEIHIQLLFEVAAASTTTLTELRVDAKQYWRDADKVRMLLEAAPALQCFEASVIIRDRQVARNMLRNEPPFQALWLQKLYIDRRMDATADVVAFSSDLRSYASLKKLILFDVDLHTAAAMGAVADACIAVGLRALRLSDCRVVPAVLPELTRLVAAGLLRELVVSNDSVEMFDEAHESTRLFVAAVRASAMTRLWLNNVGVLPVNVAEVATFTNTRR